MSIYQDRMINYYPEVVKAITEFQAIITAESPIFEQLANDRQRVLNNAFLTSEDAPNNCMDEERIAQWEKILGITPLQSSTIEDRRATIVARIKGQGKLNTETINNIVKTFTNGTAISWVENSTLYVEITPPPDNKSYRFENVEQELKRKIPAHLGFNVRRNYYDWQDVYDNQILWQTVYDLGTWNNVYLFTPSN